MLVLLIIGLISHCYGRAPPTAQDVLSAIDRATALNAAQRGVASLLATDQEPAVNSCPHMLRNYHGKRTSEDKVADKRANDLLGAAQLLVKDGFSMDGLQSNSVRGYFQERADCPDRPICTGANVDTYRTADGSCNNVASPGWGQAGQAQVRIVASAYADGISNPRATGVLGGNLPNPRTVSNLVHAVPQGDELRNDRITLHTFQMGQFLDHDVIATPAQNSRRDCCSADGKLDTGNCLPIVVSGGDARFANNYCMNFQRSAPSFCPSRTFQREQTNAITSFVDASNVYGSSDDETTALRDNGGTGALLATFEKAGTRLPNNTDNTVCKSNTDEGIFCSLAGDHRVDVVPSLTTYHTLFVKEHNRIATVLASYFSDNETIFQETRKVLVGVMQKIVYDEFLPAFLSPVAMATYRLASSNAYTYDPFMNPTVSNGFGIAYRMGHTWIPSEMAIFTKDFTSFLTKETEKTFTDPKLTYYNGTVKGMEGLAYWLSAQTSPDTDRFVEDAARNRLFEDSAGDAFDLVALNIQRGRDHGLPAYNAYRSYCGLSGLAREWEDAPQGGLTDHTEQVAAQLKEAYASPQDIDLFTGALTESPVPGGSLGPTLDCIIGDQFMKLKFGDRFWYQGAVNGFNTVQQAEIQRASMARILCDNFDFENVHSNAFVNDNLVPCDSIDSMDPSVFSTVTESGPGLGGVSTVDRGSGRRP